ncbi:MAG: family 16 glycosylhydrolase [Firmicutes bacterium]|nr:family 16 glycosylhydrolase [Bacillota bacterium]
MSIRLASATAVAVLLVAPTLLGSDAYASANASRIMSPTRARAAEPGVSVARHPVSPHTSTPLAAVLEAPHASRTSGPAAAHGNVGMTPRDHPLHPRYAGLPTFTAITPDATRYPLVVGETHQISLQTIWPDGTTQPLPPGTAGLTFRSSNPHAVTVTQDGLLRAIHPGSTTVAITYSGVTTQLMITALADTTGGAPRVIKSPLGNWDLVWNEQFRGPAGDSPDPHRWGFELGNNGGWGNDEEEYYTNSTKNAFLDGKGDLVLRALRQSMQGSSFTSARLFSKNSGNWRYGYIQIDAKLPRGGQGLWPAIWMFPTNQTYGAWPGSGEIDIMEAVNAMNDVHATVHFGNPHGMVGQWDPQDIGPGFHVFAVKWDPNLIRFYVDGQNYLSVPSNQWFDSLGRTPAPFDQPFHLILNIAVGGDWPGPVAASTPFPQQMTIHWIRVYQRASTYAWPLPGRIQANRFASSSKGIRVLPTEDLTYNPATPPVPSDSSISLVPDHKVQFTAGGQSVTYRTDIAATGRYILSLRIKDVQATSIAVDLNGHLLTTLALPDTSGHWKTVESRELIVPAGMHSLTVSASQPDTELHWLRLDPFRVAQPIKHLR